MKYLDFAFEAANMERNKEYEQAELLWRQATLHAKNNENKKWAESRCIYCRNVNVNKCKRNLV